MSADDKGGSDIAVMLRPAKKGPPSDDPADSDKDDGDDKALESASSSILDAINTGDAGALKDALLAFCQAM